MSITLARIDILTSTFFLGFSLSKGLHLIPKMLKSENFFDLIREDWLSLEGQGHFFFCNLPLLFFGRQWGASSAPEIIREDWLSLEGLGHLFFCPILLKIVQDDPNSQPNTSLNGWNEIQKFAISGALDAPYCLNVSNPIIALDIGSNRAIEK